MDRDECGEEEIFFLLHPMHVQLLPSPLTWLLSNKQYYVITYKLFYAQY